MLPLEEAILEIGLQREADGKAEFYGFDLAEQLASAGRAGQLTAHGVLYKALARLETAGLLESRWEDVDPVSEGRPRRRFYRVTGGAAAALALSRNLQHDRTKTPRWASA